MSNELLMSDVLRGQIPALEDEQFKEIEDAFVVAAVRLVRKDEEPRIVTGIMNGISMEGPVINMDIRLDIREAFDVLSQHKASPYDCDMCMLEMAQEVTNMGSYRIVGLKMMDFDRQDKTCTLGIDLFKA